MKIFLNDIITPHYTGYGAQYNHNLYAPINEAYGITPENVGPLEEKVIALGCQHSRIFYDPQADVRRDYHYQSFDKTVALAQKSGSNLNVTYWYGPYFKKEHEGDQAAIRFDIRQLWRGFVGHIRRLIIDQGMTCIKYITIQNEPNDSDDKVDLDLYTMLYEEMDFVLREFKLRDKIQIVGGDLVFFHQERWFNHMAQNMSHLLDAYSSHMYWAYYDFAYGMNRIKTVRECLNALPPDKQKPLYITEFGVRGHRDKKTPGGPDYNATDYPIPGVSAPNDKNAIPSSYMPLCAAQHGRYLIEALNAGFAGFARWDLYQTKYEPNDQDFSMIDKGLLDYALRPGYYQMLLTTHTSMPGFSVLKTEADNPQEHVAALKGPLGELTLYLMQEGDTPMTLCGLPPCTDFYFCAFNEDGQGLLSPIRMLETDIEGCLTLSLPENCYGAMCNFPIKL